MSGSATVTGSNTIFYLNCTDSITGSPLNCSAGNLCHVYANATDGASACRNTTCCSFKAGGSTTAHRIRLRPEGCKAYMSFLNLELNTDQPVSEWSPLSLELEWVTPAAAPEPTYGGRNYLKTD
ncbi:hypothetical protein CASFOL_006595 [Castilleja foliolosa]|uniref:Uncharacterized protein n=1 Tax=Castilleja foliolosa TaxID=1961234 RepID=A0ABD3E7P2_9LAMI